MPRYFDSKSGKAALCAKGGKAYARNHRPKGFPNLVRARQQLATIQERKRLEKINLELVSECRYHCPCMQRRIERLINREIKR